MRKPSGKINYLRKYRKVGSKVKTHKVSDQGGKDNIRNLEEWLSESLTTFSLMRVGEWPKSTTTDKKSSEKQQIKRKFASAGTERKTIVLCPTSIGIFKEEESSVRKTSYESKKSTSSTSSLNSSSPPSKVLNRHHALNGDDLVLPNLFVQPMNITKRPMSMRSRTPRLASRREYDGKENTSVIERPDRKPENKQDEDQFTQEETFDWISKIDEKFLIDNEEKPPLIKVPNTPPNNPIKVEITKKN